MDSIDKVTKHLMEIPNYLHAAMSCNAEADSKLQQK